MIFIKESWGKKAIILGVAFVMFSACYGYCQVLDQKSKGLLETYFEETKSHFAADPNSLKLAEEFVSGCAVLEKWDDLLPVYKRFAPSMNDEAKQAIDQSILLFRTKQVERILINSEQHTTTMMMRLLKNNPLEGLPEAVRSKMMDCMEKGWQLFQEGKFAQGKAQFEETLRVKETPFPDLYIGSFLHASGKSQEAIAYLEKGIKLAGEENVMPYLWGVLANAYANDGSIHKALSLLEGCVNRDPRDLFSLYQLADLYLRNQEDGNYLHICEKIKALDPIIFALVESVYNQKSQKTNNRLSGGNDNGCPDVLQGLWRFFIQKQWVGRGLDVKCDMVDSAYSISIKGIVNSDEQDEVMNFLVNLKKDLGGGSAVVHFFNKTADGEDPGLPLKQVNLK